MAQVQKQKFSAEQSKLMRTFTPSQTATSPNTSCPSELIQWPLRAVQTTWFEATLLPSATGLAPPLVGITTKEA